MTNIEIEVIICGGRKYNSRGRICALFLLDKKYKNKFNLDWLIAKIKVKNKVIINIFVSNFLVIKLKWKIIQIIVGGCFMDYTDVIVLELTMKTIKMLHENFSFSFKKA